MKPGQIIIVNGTSGSGKSTTCELLAKKPDEFWLLYGIDHFLAGTLPAQYGHHGALCREGIYAHPVDEQNPGGPLRWSLGPYGTKAFATMHEWIASASRLGCNIVFDHLMMIDPPVLQDAIWRMEGLPVLLVTLKPPFEVLRQRLAQRVYDKKLPTDILGADTVRIITDRLGRLRPWFYDAVYANEICDLEIDTARYGPKEVCKIIQQRLAHGPGTAFEALRDRFPRAAQPA